MIGNQGYAEEAEALFKRYESVPFGDTHRQVLHLLPAAPSLVLDIGAGTGRDAAALAAMGHNVVAVEPTAPLREGAKVLHPSPKIEWLDDGLPALALLSARGEQFDLIMMTAVWMHLDAAQRRQAMPVVARLLRTGGTLIMLLRHGAVPPGRRMFEVSGAETIQLAASEGLALELLLEKQLGRPDQVGVLWTRLAFTKTAQPK